MNWVCRYHYEKQAEFLALRKQVSSFGPEVDKALEEYVDFFWETSSGATIVTTMNASATLGIMDLRFMRMDGFCHCPKLSERRAKCTNNSLSQVSNRDS